MKNFIQDHLGQKIINFLSRLGMDISSSSCRQGPPLCLMGVQPFFPVDSRRALLVFESKGGNGATASALSINEEGLQHIAAFEGFRDHIYKDVAGYPTIGYGHLLKKGERALFEGGISKDQALQLLREDTAKAANALRELVHVDLNQNQFNALASFVFNVGRSNFVRSTLLKKLNQGQYDQVAIELKRWIHAGGKIINGLVRRREAEAELFNQPV